MAVTAAVIGIVAAVGGGAEAAHQQHVGAIQAKNASNKQAAAQLGMQQQLQQKQAQDNAQAAQEAQQADLRQRALASGYRNASGGFSTSPLGLPGDGNTAKGSLLGL